jgi:aspartate aminotransferase
MVISENMQDLVKNSSAIRKLFEEGLQMAEKIGKENVYDFSLGNPSVPAPQKVNDSIREILDSEDTRKVHGYMKNAGFDEVREAVAKHVNKEFGQNLKADDIIMVAGAAGGLNCILRCLLNPGDEVIVFAPFFGEYRSYVVNFGGKTVVVPPDTENFQLNLDAFPALVNEKTRAVILNSPNNPSGAVYRAETLDAFAKLLAEAEKKAGHPIYVISDEPYRELVYDGLTVPYMPDHIRNTIVCTSFSKSLSLPGERIGYLTVSPQIDSADELKGALICANRCLGYINAPSLFQLVVARCLDEKTNVAAYDANRKLIYESLTSYGFTCVKPQGAFYLFMKSPVEDENEFVNEGKKLGIIMVGAKSWGCPGYVRLAYCVDHDMIVRSLPAFQKLAAHYFSK